MDFFFNFQNSSSVAAVTKTEEALKFSGNASDIGIQGRSLHKFSNRQYASSLSSSPVIYSTNYASPASGALTISSNSQPSYGYSALNSGLTFGATSSSGPAALTFNPSSYGSPAVITSSSYSSAPAAQIQVSGSSNSYGGSTGGSSALINSPVSSGATYGGSFSNSYSTQLGGTSVLINSLYGSGGYGSSGSSQNFQQQATSAPNQQLNSNLYPGTYSQSSSSGILTRKLVFLLTMKKFLL
jgi:hypothetical protein